MMVRNLLLIGTAALVASGGHTATSKPGGPAPAADWAYYGGDLASTQFSPAAQINRANVGKLQIAWQYETGPEATTAAPLIADGLMFVVRNGDTIAALDPATGREIWQAPKVIDRQRGFSYWRSSDGRERRLLFSQGQFLRALDASTGKPIANFGTGGRLDLREGFGRDGSKIPSIQPVTPGKIVGDVMILGSNPGEGYDSAPGDIRAVDVRTGKFLWAFHTIPRPGEPGIETWSEPTPHLNHGGANNWGGMSVDEKLGIVYLGTGSTSYDFWGGDRKGANLYANCLLALDIKTGKLIWYFQTVHHDLWDYDITSSPALTEIVRNGRRIPVVAQATKSGMVYVFDRKTGKSIYPIEERPVPKSEMADEHAWPTQPFSALPPFARQKFTADDIDPLLPEAERKAVISQVKAARNEGLFTPPGLKDTVQMPGNHGGVNWGMTAANPKTGRFYVSSFDLPTILKLEKMPGQPRNGFARPIDRGRALYDANCAMCHGPKLEGQSGIPALTGVVGRQGTPEVTKVVRAGRNLMPAFGGTLTDADLDAVILYLANPAAAPPPPPPRNAAAPAAMEADHGASGSAATPPPAPVLRYHSSYGFMISQGNKPMIKPPWNTITAYDLNKGTILWQRPVGGMFDYPVPQTGTTRSKGGVVVTAGNLVFAASAGDRKLNAYDADTGKLLWAGDLPSVPQGVPAVYTAGGRQYVAVPVAAYSSTGAGQLGPLAGPPGKNAYVAFALPGR